jgi:hypothetical protein
MLGQNGKLFPIFQTIDLPSLANFGHREDLRFEFERL